MNLVTKSKIKSSDAISELRTTGTLKGTEACESKSGITSKITNNYTSDYMSSSLNSKTRTADYPQGVENYSTDQYQIFMSEYLNFSLNKDFEAYHTFNSNLDMYDGHKLIDIHQIELYGYNDKGYRTENQANSSINQTSVMASGKSEVRDIMNLKVAQTSENSSLSKNFTMHLNLSGQKVNKKCDSKLKVHFSPNHKVKGKSQSKIKHQIPSENINSDLNLLTCSAATENKGNKCTSNLLSQLSSSLSLKQYPAKQAKSNEGGSEDLNNLKSKVKQYKNSIPTNIKSALTSNLVSKVTTKPLINKSMQHEPDNVTPISKLKTTAISSQLIPLGKHHKSRAKDSSSQLYSSVNARPETRGSGQKSQTKTFN